MEIDQECVYQLALVAIYRAVLVSAFARYLVMTGLSNNPSRMVANASSGTNYFNLYLKAKKYSVVQTNVLPTAGNAIQVVAAFFFGILADRTGKRLLMIIIIEALVLLSNILLSVWYIPKGALLFAFYLSYAGSAAQPIIIVSQPALAHGDERV